MRSEYGSDTIAVLGAEPVPAQSWHWSSFCVVFIARLVINRARPSRCESASALVVLRFHAALTLRSSRTPGDALPAHVIRSAALQTVLSQRRVSARRRQPARTTCSRPHRPRSSRRPRACFATYSGDIGTFVVALLLPAGNTPAVLVANDPGNFQRPNFLVAFVLRHFSACVHVSVLKTVPFIGRHG